MLNIFSVWPSHNCLPKPYICIVRDKIECAIFGSNHDEIIIGTVSGCIEVRKLYYYSFVIICLHAGTAP